MQDACSGRLLQAWLLHFSGNILELLSSLDVENSMDTCQKMLKVLFEKSPTHEVIANFDLVDDSLTIPLDRLNCESALYWQCLCEYLRGLGSEGEEFLEKILPSITDFCRYLQKYVSLSVPGVTLSLHKDSFYAECRNPCRMKRV